MASFIFLNHYIRNFKSYNLTLFILLHTRTPDISNHSLVTIKIVTEQLKKNLKEMVGLNFLSTYNKEIKRPHG